MNYFTCIVLISNITYRNQISLSKGDKGKWTFFYSDKSTKSEKLRLEQAWLADRFDPMGYGPSVAADGLCMWERYGYVLMDISHLDFMHQWSSIFGLYIILISDLSNKILVIKLHFWNISVFFIALLPTTHWVLQSFPQNP